MARTIREARLGSPTARSRLRAGRQPHWNTLTAGRDHLGWQRWPEERSGRWLLRRRRGGNYSVETIGVADDAMPADGASVLTHEQARARAVELADQNPVAGRLTVSRAMADYLDYLTARGKDARDPEYAVVAHILPALGDLEVADLTAGRLRRWLADLAAQPARRRTGRGRQQKHKPAPSDEEAIRRRRSTANRVFGVLRAALNLAYAEGKVASTEWRRVKRFGQAEAARARYLSTDEAVRLLNACDGDFRLLVRAALETGARYGELARLEVADFNADAGVAAVRRSKSGRPRHVVLTKEGAEFFAKVCAGRAGSERMFLTAGGRPWAKSDQRRPMAEASQRGRIVPPITFHTLRHTYCSLCIMAGVPMPVVAQNVGHRDLRMLQTHYAHLAPSYVADAIRSGAPRFAVEGAGNVEPLRGKRKH